MSSKDKLIQTDVPYSDEERTIIKALLRMMIPPSEEYDVPGADDSRILSEFLVKAIEYETVIKKGLGALNQLSIERYGKKFRHMNASEQSTAVEAIKQAHAEFIGVLTTITLQCYYRDERVLESLDMQARPPFPVGFEVEQGDWTLLDPVRRREKLYREI